MELHEIHAFINHWHQAVLEELSDTEEKSELPSIANHLIEEIAATRALRNLATNPLLCAMLCALHRERREQLPSDRIKLYEVCCEMLIERRDSSRRISLSDYPASALSLREKLVLLEDLAYWMINNGWSEIELQKAEERFKRKLTNMHNVSAKITSSDVRKFFVERTVLIREPVLGYIDFTHRTFQEFLAAKAAVNEEDIGVLIRNAQDVQWQEVIVLAAGMATRKLREELIKNLIQRGDVDKNQKHQFYLLAISCLDTTVDLEPTIREKVKKNALVCLCHQRVLQMQKHWLQQES